MERAIVTSGKVVTIEYRVTLADGEVVEEAPEKNPVQYLQGSNMLLPALEANLEGMAEGERKQFILQPLDAYGDRDNSSVVTLPRSVFPAHLDLAVGVRLAARTFGGGIYPLTVREIHDDRVVVDLNHPLAGKALHFNVLVKDVRSASTGDLFRGKPQPVEVV